MSSSKEEAGAVPAGSKGSWMAFLKSIASFSGDLASLTAPPFILSSTSLVEFSRYWTEHPEVFVAPAKQKDPEKRALAVLKWFLSTLKQQYATRNEKFGSEKKPLNPFLGELFLGKWEGPGDCGETVLISEQVSHHPPITAYAIFNEKYGVHLEGYNGQRASFFGRTISVKQVGHAKLHLKEFDEDYLITLPSLHIEGLIYGAPYVELDKQTIIQSTSGYTARIDYSGKGWLTGKKNSFTATLSKTGHKDILYSLDGQWSEAFSIKEKTTKKELDRFSHQENKTTKLTLAPIEEMDPMESRRAWLKVAQALEKGDYDLTSQEKTKIEVEQREMRKKEKAEGKAWERRYFKTVEANAELDLLAKEAGVALDDGATGGIWLFDEAKYKKTLEK